MGRKNRREESPEPGEIKLTGIRRTVTQADGDWFVQTITGANANKVYRCPGCDMEIPIGTAHVVTWPDYLTGSDAAVGERRHWHTPCWNRRRPSGRR